MLIRSSRKLQKTFPPSYTTTEDLTNIIENCSQESIGEIMELEQDDLERIEEVDYTKRYFAFSSYRDHKDYPF